MVIPRLKNKIHLTKNFFKKKATWFKKPVFFILFIWLFHCSLDFNYFAKNNLPPAWDQSTHLKKSLLINKELKHKSLKAVFKSDSYYPPFFYLSTQPLYFLSKHENTLTKINLFYLLILLLSVYGLGRTIFNPKIGLLATVIVSFYPFTIYLRRNYLLDFSLMALISLSLYYLIKSSKFVSKKNSWLLAFFAALSVLTKPTALVFFVGPFFWELTQILKKNREIFKKHLTELLASTSIFFLTISLWYVPNFKIFLQTALHYAKRGTSQQTLLRPDPTIVSFQSFTAYFLDLKQEMSLVFFLLFLLGFFYILKIKSKRLLRLGFYIFTPYIILSLIPNKDPRFISPLLIFCALITANFISNLKIKYFKYATYVLLLITTISISYYSLGVSPFAKLQFNYLQAPKQENWQVNEILQTVSDDKSKKNKFENLLIIPDLPFINGLTYDYYAFKNNLPVRATNAAYINFEEFEHQLKNNFSYVVSKDNPPFGEIYSQVVEQEMVIFVKNKNSFRLIKVFPIPDGSFLYLWKKN